MRGPSDHITPVKILEPMLTYKNITPTPMRLLVLDFLLKQESAVSLSALEKGLEPTDRITVYRTLKTFEEKGLAHSIDDGTGTVKYALCHENCDAGHHHDVHVHFYCSYCQGTFCLQETRIPQITLPERFAAEEISLLVKGRCERCSDKTDHAAPEKQ